MQVICGITVVNALSSEFSLATYRNDYFHRITFKDAKKVEDVKEPIKKGKKHGTITSFIVNPKYLGVGCKLPMDKVIDWLEMMSYQVNDNVIFKVEEYKGIELVESKTIKKKPFSDLLKKFIPDDGKIGFAPICFGGKGKLEESITVKELDEKGKVKEKKKVLKKDVKVEFGFTYDISSMDADYVSFCNFTKTDEGGVHVDAVEDALCKFLQTATVSSMTDRQKEQYPITRPDVKAGLKLVVNLSTDAQVQFMGNAKNKIQNEALKPIIREITTAQIKKYFDKEDAKLAVVTKIIRMNAKARIDMQKIKTAKVKTNTDSFGDMENPNLIKANNTGKAYKEIFLIEGRKSAAGSLRDGRDPWTQAIFGFRGQTKNPFTCSKADILNNDEWKNYLSALKVRPEPDFRLENLYYDKIIISTDADIDGFIIGTGIAAFHVMYLPKTIEDGRLFKVYPPLYRIDDKNHPFVGNKAELTELHMKKIVKEYKLRTEIDSDYRSKDELWVFLYDTIDYLDLVSYVCNFYKIDPGLVEVLGYALVKTKVVLDGPEYPILKQGILDDQKFIRNFMQIIQKKYPESKLSGNLFSSVINGRLNTIRINDRLTKNLADLFPIYETYGMNLGVKEKSCEERTMTIGEFLSDSQRLLPKILTRFKGLGEANAEEIWDTTLNPANRFLVQLTFDNLERDFEIFRKLKSDKLVYRKQRKEMMENYTIPREEIDN